MFRQLTTILVAATTLTATIFVSGSGAPVQGAPAGWTTQYVATSSFGGAIGRASRVALISDDADAGIFIDIESGRRDPTPIPGGYPVAGDGSLAVGTTVDGQMAVQYRSGGRKDIQSTLQPDYYFSPAAVSLTGRFVATTLFNSGLASQEPVLVDTVADKVYSPYGTTAPARGFPNQGGALDIDASGSKVLLWDSACTGCPAALYVWDTTTGTFQRIDVTPTSGPQNGTVLDGAMSYNGRYVVFAATGTNIVSGTSTDDVRLFRRDLVSGTTRFIASATQQGYEVDARGIAQVSDTGEVFFIGYGKSDVGGVVYDNDLHLLASSGLGAPVQLSTTSTNQPPDGNVTYFHGLTAAGDAFYSSFATDLAAGSAGESMFLTGRKAAFGSYSEVAPTGNPMFTAPAPFSEFGSQGGPGFRPGETRCVNAVGQRGDVAIVNITPVGATAIGHGTLHSSDDPAGDTSNVNFAPGTVDPNLAFTRIGTNGQICFTNSLHASVHVVLDELAIADGAGVLDPTPTGADRLLDSREWVPRLPFQPAEVRCVTAHGEPGDYAVVNITPVGANATGHATLHSSDDPAGSTSNVNFAPGKANPNVAIAEIGPDNKVCLTNSTHATVHYVLDQLAIARNFLSRAGDDGAERLIDTRLTTPPSPLPPGGLRCVAANGSAGSYAAINITPVGPSGGGHGILYASGDAAGDTSNVNYTPGGVDPNLAFSKIGLDGKVCYSNSQHSTTNLVLDQLLIADAAYLSLPTPSGARRLLDTRQPPTLTVIQSVEGLGGDAAPVPWAAVGERPGRPANSPQR